MKESWKRNIIQPQHFSTNFLPSKYNSKGIFWTIAWGKWIVFCRTEAAFILSIKFPPGDSREHVFYVWLLLLLLLSLFPLILLGILNKWAFFLCMFCCSTTTPKIFPKWPHNIKHKIKLLSLLSCWCCVRAGD